MGTKATIRDVAALAGVSVSAVSYIMNGSTVKKYSDETVARVKNAAETLHYRSNNIARGMRSQKTHAVGVVSFWGMDNRVFVKTLEGITEAAAERGYAVVICPVPLCPLGDTMPDNFDYISYYVDRRVDGLILIAPPTLERALHERAHIDALKAQDVPFVVINSSGASDDISAVCFDYEGSTRLAVETLQRAGHRNVAYVAPGRKGFAEDERRLAGYLSAVEDPRVYRLADVTPELLTELGAVVTNKSDTALALLETAAEHGVAVPEKLSVIAGNTEYFSEFLRPALTSVEIPFGRIGARAVEMLTEELDGKGTPRIETLPCTLSVRKSAALTGILP